MLCSREWGAAELLFGLPSVCGHASRELMLQCAADLKVVYAHADCPFLMRFTAAWVYVAMATAGVSLHEKSKDYETACELLRQLLGAEATCACTTAPCCSLQAYCQVMYWFLPFNMAIQV